MPAILGGLDHRGIPFIEVEFLGSNGPVIRKCIIDTAFSGYCLLSAALYRPDPIAG